MKSQKIFDLIGVGLGPSNLALAAAVEENKKPIKSLFLEKSKSFCWHKNMLLPHAKLQVPFFRDLATLRNPQSPYTFLNYLKAHNRLDKFINLRTFYPTRQEFHDYFNWAASLISDKIKYNLDIKSISPAYDLKHKNLDHFMITAYNSQADKLEYYLSRNIVLAVGRKAFIPEIFNHQDERIIHTSSLLHSLKKYYPDLCKSYNFVIIGSGQSAGESALHILNTYPNARVTICFRSYSLKGTDSNAFINQTYHQGHVDSFYDLDIQAKQKALQDLKNSNYSVIDADLLHELFVIEYEDALQNKHRLSLKAVTEVIKFKASKASLQLSCKNLFTGTIESLNADGVILATGYQEKNHIDLLQDIHPYLKLDSTGNYQVSKDYRMLTDKKLKAKIFLQGHCENTHGPSDATLAILSTRAEKILQSLSGDSSCV